MLTNAIQAHYKESNKTQSRRYSAPLLADIFISKNAHMGKITPVSRIREVRGVFPRRSLVNTGAFLSNKQDCLQNNNSRRHIMSNTQALSKIDVTSLHMSALYAKLKIGFVQEILTRSFINEEFTLSHSSYEGLALVMEDTCKQMEEITDQLDYLSCERRGL